MRIQAGLNGVFDRLKIIQASASHRVGWSDMVDAGVQSAKYFVPPAAATPTRELTRTRAVTIDALAEQLGARPTHIKIDVEGSEADVLQGGRTTLARNDGPLLFIELHNRMIVERGGIPEHTLALLREFGYATYSTDGRPIEASGILEKPLVRIMARVR